MCGASSAVTAHSTKASAWGRPRWSAGRFASALQRGSRSRRSNSPTAATQHPSGRVSLANLKESDYRQIGRAMRKLIEEYVERFNAATCSKLDKNTVK